VNLQLDVFDVLLDPANRLDIYRHYERWQQEHSVLEASGLVFVFSHAECLALLRNRRLSVDPTQSSFGNEPDELPTLIHLDPPDHDRLRRLVQAAFTPRRVDQLRVQAEAFLGSNIEALDNCDDVDLVAELAYPLPLAVICDLLGIPAQDRPLIQGWSTHLAKSIDPQVFRSAEVQDLCRQAREEFVDYLRELVEFRRRVPSDDLLSQLVGSDQAGEHMTENELFGLAVLLLVAGHETTVSLVSNGLLALLTNRSQYVHLSSGVADPGTALEELLRFDAPVQMTSRIALEPTSIGNTVLQPGQVAILMLGAANRDPQAFTDPARLDVLTARPVPHLSFGSGLHHCLGAALARVEGEMIVSTLVKRYPNMELLHPPTLRPTFVLRGRESLRVATGRPST
jgi:cytochrome P450